MPASPMDLYADLMNEAKTRIMIVEHLLGGRVRTDGHELPPAMIREFGFLQIRMLCEVVALGCLVAHGDIQEIQSPKMQKTWDIEKTMKELDKLHPDFYPQAAFFKQTVGVNGEPAILFDRNKQGALTKKRIARTVWQEWK